MTEANSIVERQIRLPKALCEKYLACHWKDNIRKEIVVFTSRAVKIFDITDENMISKQEVRINPDSHAMVERPFYYTDENSLTCIKELHSCHRYTYQRGRVEERG